MRTLLPAVLLVVASPAIAQVAPLTVRTIMQDPNTWVGAQPSGLQWSETGDRLWFRWNPQGAFASDSLFWVPSEGGEPVQATRAERLGPRPTFSGWQHGQYAYDASLARKVFVDGGDIFVLDRESSEILRLTNTVGIESRARFTPDESAVVYYRDGQAWRHNLDSGALIQLTDLRSGKEPEDEELSEQAAWLKAQQRALFDVVREREEEREATEAARDRDAEHRERPRTYWWGKGNVRDLQVDPLQRYASMRIVESAENPSTAGLNFVTADGYAAPLTSRPKVGAQPATERLVLLDLDSGEGTTVDLSTLPGAFDVQPVHLREQGVEVDSSSTRAMEVGPVLWSPDGSMAIVQVRTTDFKDRWMARLDPVTGALSVLHREHEDTWVSAPAAFWWGFDEPGWFPDGRTLWFRSEQSGFAHLYTVDVESGRVNQLTDGDFEVTRVQLSRDAGTFFLETSEASPQQRHWYRMDAAGGPRVRLTADVGQGGTSRIHPSETRIAIRHSTSTQPFEVALQTFGGQLERITHSTTEAWESYDWRTPELIQIPASDGVDVPGHLFRPEETNGAAVFFVHGAGYAQNVHNWWPSYFREYMFHNLLAERGYTVVQLDFRASKGYGRDWRTAIYRHMGGRDLQDYVDASRWVGTEFGIDPERVFIYGGSYGGFITLMALFTESEHFGGGAALRSVTDWAHYNHTYTAAILNTPDTDSLAYARSSPINFAEGLEDPLLMPHGVIDMNVQYQDIIRLAQRFIELGKTDWELASYPVEPHGFREPSSWTDEYRRILELIERTVGPGAPTED